MRRFLSCRSRRALCEGVCAAALFAALPTLAAAQQDAPVQLQAIELDAAAEKAYAPAATGATKTDLAPERTPQAVSVVTEGQLEDRAPRSVSEALRYVPGAVAETFGADTRNDWFMLRGFASQQQSYFTDGLQLPSHAFATWRLSPFTLSAVEVLRGPSSGLFGASAPGGLVNARTKRAQDGDFGSAFVSIDENGHSAAGVDINRSAGDWSYRLAATGRVGETGVDFTDDDGFALAPSLTWRPSEATTLELYANVSSDRTNGQNFLPYVGTEVDAPFGKIDPELFASEPGYDHFNRDQWMTGWNFEHKFDGGPTFRQNARYAELEVDFTTVYGGGYAATPTATTAELARYNFITQPRATLINVDNQLAFDVSTGAVDHDLTVGLELKRYTLDDSQGFAFDTSLDLLNPVYTGAAEPTSRYILDSAVQNQAGVYVQDVAQMGGWTAIATGRADYVSIDVESPIADDYSTDDIAFSGRLAVLHAFDNGLAPYAAVSRSFAPVVGRDTVTGTPFEPETGTQIEAGVKFAPKGWGVQASAAVFNLVRENVSQSNAAFQTSQVGEVTSKGIELELAGDPAPGLHLQASAMFSSVVVTGGTALDKGFTPTSTPETLLSAYADYTLQDGPLEGLGFGVGVRHVGSSWADRANTLKVSARTLVDVALHYDLPFAPGATATLSVTNLFDDQHVAGCSGANSCFYGEGRQAMLRLGYSW